MTLGANIRKARRALNMNQVQFAKKLQVSQASVSQWERGFDKPSPAMLYKLADITGDSSFVTREVFTNKAKPLSAIDPLPPKTTMEVLIEINTTLKRIADVLEEQYS